MRVSLMSCMFPGKSPREIVAVGQHCGLDAIDWISLHHSDPRFLRKISQDAGLEIVSHTMIKSAFLQRKPRALDEFKQSLEDACTLGAPVLMVPPFPRVNQVSPEDDRKAWIEHYAEMQPLAQAAGVTLTLESTGYINSPITTAEEVLEVLHAVPGLRLTFDYGNMATAPGDLLDAYRRLQKYILRFHLKDWKISDVPTACSECKRTGKHFENALIGTGNLDLRGFWNEVAPEQKSLPVNFETRDYTERLGVEDALRQAMAVF